MKLSFTAEFPRVRFQCTLCGECCRRYWIPVTHIDVARIARYTGLRPREFVALFPKDMAAQWDEPLIKLSNGEYYLILKKRLDGTCIFNKWVDGKLICSVHEVKPYVCRYYPFIYWLEGGVIKFEVYDKALNYCPGLNRGSYATFKVEVKSMPEVVKAKREFKEFVERWNNMVRSGAVRGTLEEFLNYLEETVSQLQLGQ
nr:YkgJ family cysteine cluster protein [Vulcanisaeta thermophila]